MSDTPRTFPELPAEQIAVLKAKALGASIHKLTSDLGAVYVKAPDSFAWQVFRESAGLAAETAILSSTILAPSFAELKALAAERELPGVMSRLAVEVAEIATGITKVRSEKL